MTIQELAKEYAGYFKKQKRRGARARGEEPEFWTLKDDAPEELKELVKDAHGEFLPDDWRYGEIYLMLDRISGYDTDDPDELRDDVLGDLEPDPYTADRLTWLASNINRPAYVDEFYEEYGITEMPDGGIVEMVGMGQLREMEEVLSLLIDGLAELAEEEDEDDDEEE